MAASTRQLLSSTLNRCGMWDDPRWKYVELLRQLCWIMLKFCYIMLSFYSPPSCIRKCIRNVSETHTWCIRNTRKQRMSQAKSCIRNTHMVYPKCIRHVFEKYPKLYPKPTHAVSEIFQALYVKSCWNYVKLCWVYVEIMLSCAEIVCGAGVGTFLNSVELCWMRWSIVAGGTQLFSQLVRPCTAEKPVPAAARTASSNQWPKAVRDHIGHNFRYTISRLSIFTQVLNRKGAQMICKNPT